VVILDVLASLQLKCSLAARYEVEIGRLTVGLQLEDAVYGGTPGQGAESLLKTTYTSVLYL
jgi:hypothetical protein